MEETNGAVKIGDLMANMMKPSASAEAEILGVVAKYSLQLRPDQQLVLNRLVMVTFNNQVPAEQKLAIKAFVIEFCETKRYHDTLEYIGRTVDAMSLRRFMDNQSIKGQVVKMPQQ